MSLPTLPDLEDDTENFFDSSVSDAEEQEQELELEKEPYQRRDDGHGQEQEHGQEHGQEQAHERQSKEEHQTGVDREKRSEVEEEVRRGLASELEPEPEPSVQPAHESETDAEKARPRVGEPEPKSVPILVSKSVPEPVVADPYPVHPIPSMQGAFEESIVESAEEMRDAPTHGAKQEKPGPQARRQRLLDEEEKGPQWRRKPGAKYHPFWKLAAQISFGVHLLHRQLAKSDEEVVKILQTHVDEVDGFLEQTTEDFDLAVADIKERINFLRLPLEHVEVFDTMLDDRSFRTSIAQGNEKIERIVDRTREAMNDALDDVEKGLEAIAELERYLNRIGSGWAGGNAEHMGVYTAMRGNTEGWNGCFRRLQVKGNNLAAVLAHLETILRAMSRRAAIASRRNSLTELSAQSSKGRLLPARVSTPPPTSKYSSAHAPNKPLPRVPQRNDPSIETQLAWLGAASKDGRFESPRKQPRPPRRSSSTNSDNRLGSGPKVPMLAKMERFMPENGLSRSNSVPTNKAGPPLKHQGTGSGTLLKAPQGHVKPSNVSPATMPDSAYSSGSDNRLISPSASKQAAQRALFPNPSARKHSRSRSKRSVGEVYPSRPSHSRSTSKLSLLLPRKPNFTFLKKLFLRRYRHPHNRSPSSMTV